MGPTINSSIMPEWLTDTGITNTNNTSNTLTEGAKYLIMTRKNINNSSENLSKVSPFIIKKIIDYTCGGEIDQCKKLRNGNVLIKTKNNVQANKLLKLKALTPTIEVDITVHNSLNYSKGVVYCNDLIGISDNEIIAQLKSQKVVKVENIKKKVDSILVETGLFIITFDSLTLPETLAIGYEKIRVRTYIPRPMRCINCNLYWHTIKFCKSAKSCANCSLPHHINIEAGEKCKNTPMCANCKLNEQMNCNHNIFDKSCPTFMMEKEIQAIITIEKKSRKTAIDTYKQRNNNNKQSYASASRSSLPSSATKQTSTEMSSTNTSRPILDYGDLIQLKNKPSTTSSTNHTKNITILPTKTSNRTRTQLKKKLMQPQKPKLNVQTHDDSSDLGGMDLEN